MSGIQQFADTYEIGSNHNNWSRAQINGKPGENICVDFTPFSPVSLFYYIFAIVKCIGS